MTRRYLHTIYVGRYGALEDRLVGPLEPGLNIIEGPNEMGKSTISSLVGGVLYGWEDAHGVRNTYRPPDGSDRQGTLVWREFEPAGNGPAADGSAENGSLERAITETIGMVFGENRPRTPRTPRAPRSSQSSFTLTRDEAALQATPPTFDPTADLDRATYRTLFSLTSDELRSLGASSDITARLLTAGSGTQTSPSAAFAQVEDVIARLTGTEIPTLASQLDEKLSQVKAATSQADLARQHARELSELTSSREAASVRIAELNDEIEAMIAQRSEHQAAIERQKEQLVELGRLQDELAEIETGHTAGAPFDPRVLDLDSASERVLRDRLDELEERRQKIEGAVDLAKENSATSTAAYEALVELDDVDDDMGGDGENAVEGGAVETVENGGKPGSRSTRARIRRRNRRSQAILPALLTIAFIAVGLPLFMHGRDITSLSFTALGLAFVVLACMIAVAGVAVQLRPDPLVEQAKRRKQDAQWVMLQDRKKLDSTLADKREFDGQVDEYLQVNGLAAAEGSIRQARSLLDEAAEIRTRLHALDQKTASLQLRIAQLAQVTSAFEEPVQLPIAELTAQRDALIEASASMNERFGELRQELASAVADESLGVLKLEYHQLRSRMRDAKKELVVALLAKRMLERSIAAWENRQQPQVYAQASRLLSMITEGKWTQVSVSATGSLVAIDAAGTERDPRHLSLGTCQQLYLALRIALLMSMGEVGKDIPVICDDILVNFDGNRRRGALLALEELARTRQVILFVSL